MHRDRQERPTPPTTTLRSTCPRPAWRKRYPYWPRRTPTRRARADGPSPPHAVPACIVGGLGCPAAEASLLFDDIVEIAEPSQSGQRLVHPPIVGKVFRVAVQKPPVSAGERASPIAHPLGGTIPALAAIVAHPIDVGTARGVRLGRHQPAVGVLRHADHIGNHHPVVAVDEAAVDTGGGRGGV